jgi:hypothetical protein
MLNPESITEQETLLYVHRQTLAHYLYQRASLGELYMPPGVTHGIVEARAYIRYIKQVLRQSGLSIDDHPNDEEPVDIKNTVVVPHRVTDKDFAIYMWERLDPLLQDAFSLACNAAREQGRSRIQTKDLFAAIMRIQPDPLSELLCLLPPSALPKPLDQHISIEPRILHDNPQFSACIADSLNHIGQKATLRDTLSSTELFVDIAKYGTGNSVTQLRQHGINPEKIDTLIRQFGWSIRTR